MRYLAIAVNSGGPIHDDWGIWKTGQLLLVDVANTTKRALRLRGKTWPGTSATDTVEIYLGLIDNVWKLDAQSVIDTAPPFGFSTVLKPVPEDQCYASYDYPLNVVEGPAPQPEILRLTKVIWNETSLYPYYG